VPGSSKALDVKQGFNFDKDSQERVGFVTFMKMGGQKLAADQSTLMDPESPIAVLDSGAVAVLSSILWETGITDPMYLSGEISTENGQKIAELLLGSWSNIEVEFAFSIYEYDPVTKKYVKVASVDKPLRGLIEQKGSDLDREVATVSAQEVQSPQNYSFRLERKGSDLNREMATVSAQEVQSPQNYSP
jgi:hypothetical protein